MKVDLPLLIIGIIFLSAGILLLVKQLKSKRNNTSSVMAEVTDYRTEISHDSDSGDSVVYFPVMRYYANGKWYEGKSDVGRGKQRYSLGEHIEILYDPQHPENFIISGDNTVLIVSVISILIGIGIVLLAFFSK